MFGSAVRRRRRWLLAILSFLFAAGFAVSVVMAQSERNAALDSVAERARNEAQLAEAILTGRQLTKPITGSSYEKLAAEIWNSVSSEGSISGVTIWSSRGRILFSLNEKRVGNAPAEMRSLISGIANGSGSTRVIDDTVQTFTPISKSIDGPVAVVEVDQPFALVEAQTGGLWSQLRLGSAVGLAVFLLLLGVTFVTSMGAGGAREDAEPARPDDRREADEGRETKAERQQPEPEVEPPGEQRVPTYAELFGLPTDLDDAIPAGAPEAEDRPADDDRVMEAEGQPSAEHFPAEQQPAEQVPAEQLPAEQPPVQQVPAEQRPTEGRAPASEEDVRAHQADLEEAMDQVEALEAQLEEAVDQDEAPDAEEPAEPEESIGGQWPEEFRQVFQDMARGGNAQTQEMRQRREEFKNRAKQAELRLKKQGPDVHETPSAPSSER